MSFLRVVKRYLLSFTPNFKMALMLWPVLSAVLTIPILAYLYHKRGRLHLMQVVESYLAVLYLLGLVCFTLYPLPQGPTGLGFTYGVPWQTDPLRFVKDFRAYGWHSVPQLAFNVAFFMPLGFIAGRLFRLGFFGSTLLGLCASLLIETAQGTGVFGMYAYPYRCADVNDLMTNTLGAMLGWVCDAVFSVAVPHGELAKPGEYTYKPSVIRRFVAFALDAVFVFAAALGISLLVTFGFGMAGNTESFQGIFLSDAFGWSVLGVFVLFEGLIPWLDDGKTIGGSIVRMSFETKRRSTGRRAVYYLVRLLVLGFVCLAFPPALLVLGAFCLVAGKEPYDFI